MRQATRVRTTKETEIELTLNLDGAGKATIETGIPFLDHMLILFAFHGAFDLTLKARGDVSVDSHHTAEDIGILLGEVFNEALSDKKGLSRYASLYSPMDETLARIALDISNRPTLVFDFTYHRPVIGGLALENVREFLHAFVNNARVTLHASVLYGDNDHHKVEAVFKGLGRALNAATRQSGLQTPSSKGVL